MNTILKESDLWSFLMVKKDNPPQPQKCGGNTEIQWETVMLNASLCSVLCVVRKWHTPWNVPSPWQVTKKCLFSNYNPHCAFQPCCSHWKELRHRGKLASLRCHLFGFPLRCQEVENWHERRGEENPGQQTFAGPCLWPVPFSCPLFVGYHSGFRFSKLSLQDSQWVLMTS